MGQKIAVISWRGFLQELRLYLNAVKRWTPTILLFLILFEMVLGVVLVSKVYRGTSFFAKVGLCQDLELVKLFFTKGSFTFVLVCLMLPWTTLWILLFKPIGIVFRYVSNLVLVLLSVETTKVLRTRQRARLVVGKSKFMRRFVKVVWLCAIAWFIFYILYVVPRMGKEVQLYDLMRNLLYTMLVLATVTFAFATFVEISIYRPRGSRKFRKHCFALMVCRESNALRLKEIVAIALFVLFAVKVIIPTFIGGIYLAQRQLSIKLESSYDYTEKRESLVEILPDTQLEEFNEHLPELDDVFAVTAVETYLLPKEPRNKLLIPLFYYVVIFSFFYMGLPTGWYILRFKGERQRYRVFLKRAMQSSILLFVIEVVIKRGYFGQPSGITDLSSLFILLNSVLLNLDTLKYKDILDYKFE